MSNDSLPNPTMGKQHINICSLEKLYRFVKASSGFQQSIQGVPYFMTHVGQKIDFSLIGHLCLFLASRNLFPTTSAGKFLWPRHQSVSSNLKNLTSRTLLTNVQKKMPVLPLCILASVITARLKPDALFSGYLKVYHWIFFP